MDLEEIKKLSINELYLEIGKEESKLPFGDENNQESQKIGKRWFDFQLGKLKRNLCKNLRLQSMVMNDSLEDELIITVTDIIQEQYTGISFVYAGVIIVKLGLQKICRWK